MSTINIPGKVKDIFNTRLISAFIIIIMGIIVLFIPVFDIYDDAAIQGKPLYSTLLENSPLVLISLIFTFSGIWLSQSSLNKRHLKAVVKWTLFIGLSVLLLISWILGIQYFIQGELKPLIIAGNTLLLTVLIGFLVGLYNAKAEKNREEMRKERNRFAALFENVPNSVVGVKLENGKPIVQDVNPIFEEIFGYSKNEIIGENLNNYIVPLESETPAIEKEKNGKIEQGRGGWEEFEVKLETKEGLREFLRITATTDEKNPEEEQSYAIYIDITERKQRKERLHVVSRFLRHNIRNQLNVMKLSLSELEGKISDKNKKIVENLQDKVESLMNTSEKAHYIETVVSGESSLIEINATENIKNIVEDLREDYHSSTFKIDVPKDLFIKANESFNIAIRETLENAVEHNNKEDSVVRISTEKSTDGEYIDINIEDNGPGIPKEEIKLIKGEINRDQMSHSRGGIGIWAVNWIVTELGGKIEFSENDPEGSIVTLRFPYSGGI